MPEHWKAISTAGAWQFPGAAVTAPILAKESANLIFQGFPQLYFVDNQFPQWDVIHFDWPVKIIFSYKCLVIFLFAFLVLQGVWRCGA